MNSCLYSGSQKINVVQPAGPLDFETLEAGLLLVICFFVSRHGD
jgi:hypothetical protein